MSVQNLKPSIRSPKQTKVRPQRLRTVHIHIRQIGKGRKVTTIQGLPKKFEAKKTLKTIKKKFAYNGNIFADAEMGELIQLQGDQRNGVQKFLTKEEGLDLDSESVKVHGF